MDDPNATQIQIVPAATTASSSQEPAVRPVVARMTLSSASDLLKLLPTGTVLAFQALAPSFSNHGVCYAANRYLVATLIASCATSCVLLSFTDSLVGGDGKLYHGVATLRGLYPFNFTGTPAERDATFKDLARFRITALDVVHAFFSAIVFLAVALADASIQGCLFPDAGPDVRELLVNLPLGAGFLSSVVFMIFPTTRKSIGYSDTTTHAQ